MSYNIYLELRNPDILTVEELDRRLLDAGATPSPAREEYPHASMIGAGTVQIWLDKETQRPDGEIVFRWGLHPDDLQESLLELLRIAEIVGFEIVEHKLGKLQADNLDPVLERYDKASKNICDMLGTIL